MGLFDLLNKNATSVRSFTEEGLRLHEIGRYADAIQSFDKALSLDSGAYDAWIGRGSALFYLDRYSDAITSFDKAIEINPRKPDAWKNRGRALQDLARPSEAVESYTRSLDLNPKDTDTLYYRGLALQKLGRPSEAIESYDLLLKIDQNNADCWFRRGVALDELGRYADSVKSYDRALAIDPSNAVGWYNRGVALERLIRLQDAIESYQRALEIAPNHPGAKRNLPVLLDEIKRDTAGRSDEVLSISPEDGSQKETDSSMPFPIPEAETVDTGQENDEPLIDDTDDSTSLDDGRYGGIPTSDSALSVEEMKADMNDPRGERTEAEWGKSGMELASAGRFDEALLAYDRALENNSGIAYLWVGRGLALQNLQRYTEAVTSFDNAIDLDPNNAKVWYNRGLALQQLKQYDDAIESYDRALEIDSHLSAVRKNRDIAQSAKQKEEGLGGAGIVEKAIPERFSYSVTHHPSRPGAPVFDEVVELDENELPEIPELSPVHQEAETVDFSVGMGDDDLSLLSEIDETLLNPEEEAEHGEEGATGSIYEAAEPMMEFQEPEAREPDKAPWGDVDTAMLPVNSGYSDALKRSDYAISKNPDDETAWYNRGVALLHLERYEEAVLAYDRALARNPGMVDIWNNRGVALARLGRHEDALKSYDRALLLDPVHGNSWINRARSLTELGQSADAVESYDRALAVDPRDASVWYSRGVLLAEIGRAEEAVQSLDKALSIGYRTGREWYGSGHSPGYIDGYAGSVETGEESLSPDPVSLHSLAADYDEVHEMGKAGEEAVGSVDMNEASGASDFAEEPGDDDTPVGANVPDEENSGGSEIADTTPDSPDHELSIFESEEIDWGEEPEATETDLLLPKFPEPTNILSEADLAFDGLPPFMGDAGKEGVGGSADMNEASGASDFAEEPDDADTPVGAEVPDVADGTTGEADDLALPPASIEEDDWGGDLFSVDTDLLSSELSQALSDLDDTEDVGDLDEEDREVPMVSRDVFEAVSVPDMDEDEIPDAGDMPDAAFGSDTSPPPDRAEMEGVASSSDAEAAGLEGGGSFAEILKYYDRAITRTPDDADVWYNRGLVLYNLGRYRDAVKSFERAVALNPGYAEAEKNRRILLELIRKKIADYERRGTELATEGRFEEAVLFYDQVLALDPENVSVWYNRGVALRNCGRHADAVVSYDRALALTPDDPGTWYNRGVALRNLGRYSDAIDSYDHAIGFAPDDADTWLNRGVALRKLGRYDEAVTSFDRALLLNPDDPDIWYNRGVALRKLRRYEEALESYDRMLALDPENPLALNNRGFVLNEIGRYDEAVESYNKSIFLNPESAGAWVGRGYAEFNSERYADAIESLNMALGIDPDDGYTWQIHGLALARLDRNADAVQSYDRAIALDPGDARIWLIRGLSLMGLDSYHEASLSFERALELDPDNPDIIAHRDEALRMETQEHGAGSIKEEIFPLEYEPSAFTNHESGRSHLPAASFTITLDHSRFIRNQWHRVPLTIHNEGASPLIDLKVSFSEDFVTKRLIAVTVPPIDQVTLDIGVKPLSVGMVPLDLSAAYRDEEGNECSRIFEFWIEVLPGD